MIVSVGSNVNEPPILATGGYPMGLTLPESTPVGTKVFTLKAHDPEGSPVKYGIQLTDKFVVNPQTGVISLAKPLDREVIILESIHKFSIKNVKFLSLTIL